MHLMTIVRNTGLFVCIVYTVIDYTSGLHLTICELPLGTLREAFLVFISCTVVLHGVSNCDKMLLNFELIQMMNFLLWSLGSFPVVGDHKSHNVLHWLLSCANWPSPFTSVLHQSLTSSSHSLLGLYLWYLCHPSFQMHLVRPSCSFPSGEHVQRNWGPFLLLAARCCLCNSLVCPQEGWWSFVSILYPKSFLL